MRRRVAFPVLAASVACLVAGLVAVPARAEPTPAERAQADGLFQEAKKLLARGKTPEACAKLEQSFALDPVGGTLMNLANCHEILGRLATAWSEFESARTLAKKAGRADREKAAVEHLAALDARLPHLTVTVPAASALPGIEIVVDGVPLPPAARGWPSPVDPGTHLARASAPGRQAWEAQVALPHDADCPTIDPAASRFEGAPRHPNREPSAGPRRLSESVANGRTASATVAFRVARLGGASVDDVLAPDRPHLRRWHGQARRRPQL
jgi:hypothetical protein